uniref:Uncharacterized protein n=1 Tax=Guillardia theta TaxID=55529 RepID=A0A7S4NSF4_GUITH
MSRLPPASAHAGLAKVVEELLGNNRLPELDVASYLPFSAPHRLKCRLWQAVTVLVPLLTPAEAERTAGMLVECLRKDERKSVRYYMELSMFCCMCRQPSLLATLLLPLLREFNADVPLASSLMIISNFAIRSYIDTAAVRGGAEGAEREEVESSLLLLRGEEIEETIVELVRHLLPWCSHHTHHIRVLACLALKRFRSSTSAVSLRKGEELLAEATMLFMQENEETSRMLSHIDRLFFSQLDVSVLASHDTVFTPVIGDGEALGEKIPDGLVQAIEREMGEYHRAMKAAKEEPERDLMVSNEEEGDVASNWMQRKYQPELDIAGRAGGQRGKQHAGEEAAGVTEGFGERKWRRRTCELVVVASLIEKMPNLAGLARTCEIFQTQAVACGP